MGTKDLNRRNAAANRKIRAAELAGCFRRQVIDAGLMTAGEMLLVKCRKAFWAGETKLQAIYRDGCRGMSIQDQARAYRELLEELKNEAS